MEYFDSFIIGLTATPDKRTFAFFNQNVVSEYSREQAIIDGVNVGEDIFFIETEIGRNGASIMKQVIEYRNRLTRAKRWKQMDEDVTYTALNLDRDVVNPSQIRTVIKTFKENLFTQLFPYRKEVPKTLIFAKTDSHADDIIQIVREEFGEGNNFCQKITYQVEKPESVLSSFRNDYNPRIAVTVDILTPEQEQLFLDYIKNSAYYSQYYDAIYILLHTGLRISEFCGLTLKDIDLSSRTISINHQLLKRRDGSYYIEAVKTASGERILPMTDSVYCCIQRLIETRKRVKKEPVIDGYRDFIVLTKNNMPIVADHWNIRFRNILNSYNKTQDEPLPSITPHVCRHTYCTKMVQSGMNLKNLQYLMGHSDIKITLGTYTHTSIAIVQAEVEELERKGLIR